MSLFKTIILTLTFISFISNNYSQDKDDYFSSWEEIPKIINSITAKNYSNQLNKLHQLTLIKLGFPQSSLCLNEVEHELYMQQTKVNWEQWWEKTGNAIVNQKKLEAKVDSQAFQLAWDFLGIKETPPITIWPVWIPKNWTLYISYSNGDYFGREKEIWIINRFADGSKLTKLRGEYEKKNMHFGEWRVILSEYTNFSTEEADKILKSISYLHHYAPAENSNVPNNKLKGYYPHAKMYLRDDEDRIIWNTEGYEFSKSQLQYGDGETGRTYYFLKTIYADQEKWKEITEPSALLLAPYRKLLFFSKPYFNSEAKDITQFFSQKGTLLDWEAMIEWGKKQKASTDPNMNWQLCSDHFNTGSKNNIINFTRMEIQNTLKDIKQTGNRLLGAEKLSQNSDVKELDEYITNMLNLMASENEKRLQSYPQPLRTLIIASEHPNDSDLKFLTATIQEIRNNPDPLLFSQLIKEMHEGTLKMKSLLEYILINSGGFQGLKPWGDKEELIAVNACIDALPQVKEGSEDKLIAILLRLFGGGKIEIEGKNGGKSIEVRIKKNGYSQTFGSAKSPLPIIEAQKELMRLYLNSKKGQENLK